MSNTTEARTDEPPTKRTKTDGHAASRTTGRLFVPFRALGVITNHVPFAMQARSHKGATGAPRLHILTCLGKSWALWEGGKMTLLFVGQETTEPITCLAMDGDAVWASTGTDLVKYIRGKEVLRLHSPFDSPLSTFIVFGKQLLALTDDGKYMPMWSLEDNEFQGAIEFERGFTASKILHPATYLNKVLVASSQGCLELWNIRTRTCIHKIPRARISDSDKDTPCPVTALVQSPAIDVVGVGYASGEIVLYDIRADERLLRMFMEGGKVTSLSFRSDGEALLASASGSGHIAVWDLNAGGSLLHMMRGVHDMAVTAVEWVPNQPVLISSGRDNSVKQWVTDSPTALPRLLKFRSGHHEPPHFIRYYGEDGKQLLTASSDCSFRYTSVVRDSRSFELSQGHVVKKATSLSIPVKDLKFKPVISLSFSSTRSKDWDDVLTAHEDSTYARTWSVREKKLGKHSMGSVDVDLRDKKSMGPIKTVCVTACGNFGIIGTAKGVIQMWNIQSGIKRKDFKLGPRPATSSSSRPSGNTKSRAVTGLATDALNRLLIASTQDGTINFFNFHTAGLEQAVLMPAGVSSISLQQDSGLLAVTCEDGVVRLLDIETRKTARELTVCSGRILDVAFSPDSRWLTTTSDDSIIRTFDIPTGRLIDAFRTPSVATSLSFSPTGDFLATAHEGHVSIHLWANRAQFTDVTFHHISEDEIGDQALPTMQGEGEDEGMDALSSMSAEEHSNVFNTSGQLAGDLITLTLLPRSRWQSLLNLDVIQQRNKPKEPPKAPEKAPFFLPTLPGVEHRFAVNQQPSDEPNKKQAKRLEIGATQVDSAFFKKLRTEDPDGDYEGVFSYVKTLSPAAIDIELRSLVTIESLTVFINALARRLRSHKDFEAVETLMNVFLRMHDDVFIANSKLHEPLESLRRAQAEESSRLLDLVNSSLGALGFIRDVL